MVTVASDNFLVDVTQCLGILWPCDSNYSLEETNHISPSSLEDSSIVVGGGASSMPRVFCNDIDAVVGIIVSFDVIMLLANAGCKLFG